MLLELQSVASNQPTLQN